MASRLDDLIREHAQRLDQLAGPIDLADVTSAPRHDTTTVALVDNEHTWTRPEGRHRWPVTAVAAAAVVAVVVGGLVLGARDDSEPQVPAATVAPRRETGVFEPSSPRVTYTVPNGWKSIGGSGVIKQDPMIGLIFVNAEDNFYTNCCQTTSGRIDPPVGPTVDDLVSAWANLPGVDATAARDVTIDGFDGKHIELTVPVYRSEDSAGMFYRCSGGVGRPVRCDSLLRTPTWNGSQLLAQPDTHREVWVLDVDGTRVMIVAWSFPDTSQQDRAALDEIVASVHIG